MVVTDYWCQGATFEGDLPVVMDLSTYCTKKGGHFLSRANVYVALTRYRSLDHVYLLRPLWRNEAERREFLGRARELLKVDEALQAEDERLRRLARQTWNLHHPEGGDEEHYFPAGHSGACKCGFQLQA